MPDADADVRPVDPELPVRITVLEYAAMHNCSTSLVYRWIGQGRLKTEKIGSITVVDSRAKRPSPLRRGRKKA